MAPILPTLPIPVNTTKLYYPSQKYTAIATAAFAQNDWRYKRVNRPFKVQDPVAYGIVVQSSRFIEQQIYDSSGNIIQSNFVEEITFAIRRTLYYYNKLVSESNIEALVPVTVLDSVELSAAPASGPTPAPVGAGGSSFGTEGEGAAAFFANTENQNSAFDNKYYILIDAASFDAIPSLGSYILTPMTKRTSIGALAEEYREYFRVTDRTDRGHRARIAEILRTNGVDVLFAQKVDVAEWIYRVNYGVVDPPGKDAKFNAGSEIYLPRTEPDFTKVISGGQEIELTIGEISNNIDKLTSMMETYKNEIQNSLSVYRTLNWDKQIGLLKEFYPRLVAHFRSNEYRINDFFADKVRIGIDENYFLIYVGLASGGSTAYLNKALPGLAVESPFNDPRTMNFIAKLVEISLENPSFLTWEDFVSRYVFPEAIKESRKAIDQLSGLKQSPMSILEQLASRFDKFPVKSERILGEENDILATPKLMAAIVEQQTNAVSDVGDAVMQNLGFVAAKIEDPFGGQCPAKTVFSEVLNKIDYRSLAAAALECLMEQVPFDCEDIILTVAGLGDSTDITVAGIGTETVSYSGLIGINQAFKSRMKQEHKNFAEEALAVAQSKDFTLYSGSDFYGFQFYAPLAEVNAEKSEGEIYLAALEYALTLHGIDYASIFQEVCGLFSNPIQLVPDLFSVPTLFFPDNLPTVDIDAGYMQSIEKAMFDAIINIIVKMVQGLINTLLNNCLEAAELVEGDQNNSTNNDDLAAAIAANVGDDNFGDILADLVNSFPGAPPLPTVSDFTGSVTPIIGEPISAGFDIVEQNLTSKIQAIQSFFEALKNTFSTSVNNMQLISLLQGNAPDNVVSIVLGVLHPTPPPDTPRFPYGPEGQFSLAADITTLADVREVFELIAKYVEIRPIIEDLNVIAGKVGCADLNDFISQRVPLWCGATEGDNIPGYGDSVITDGQDTIRDLWCIVMGCPDLLPPCYDVTCVPQEECDVDAQSAPRKVGGAVSTDPYSFSHMLAHVVKNFFDPVYMAYDTAVLTVPEPYYKDVQETKTVDRVMKADGTINLEFFNFSKLQSEKVELPLGDATQALNDSLGIDLFETRKATVMDPEFKRLLATGYVPDRGALDGFYGPYTTPLPTTTYLKDNNSSPDALGPVTVQENVAQLAPNSKYILGEVDDSLQFFSGEVASTGDPTFTFFLSEPINNNDLGQFEQTIMRIDLLKDNKWRLQVGKMSLEPKIGQIPLAPGFTRATSTEPFLSTANQANFDEAIFDTEYSGVHTFPEKAREVLEYIADRTEPVTGEITQVKLLAEFMRNIFNNGQRQTQAGIIPFATMLRQQAIDSFSKNVMFPDITKQMSFGIGKACVDSPMLRFAKENNAPYMALVDWAPIPSEEEAECGYDPHILAIDTMIKRVIEQYEEEIECAPPENQISTDGQGRNGLSALEAATMSGLVMTTLRAYALEQLFREIFPISAFPCNDVLTPIQIKFIVDRVKEELSESKSYYNAFLEQVERVFADRMKDFSAFGTIPDVVAAGKEIGIEWVYADCAIREYEANTIHEEPFVTTPSGEKILYSDITANAIQEQLSNLPLPDNLPAGASAPASDLFNPRSSVSDAGTDLGSAGTPSGTPSSGLGFGTDDRPLVSDAGTDLGSAGRTSATSTSRTSTPTSRPPKWETCTIRGAVRGTTIQGYRAYGSDDPCIPGPIPSDTAKAPADDTPSVATIEASLDPELEASLHIHSCEITPRDLQSGTPAINGYRVDDGPCIYNTYEDARDAYDASQTSATGTTLPAKFEIVDASSLIPITEEPPPVWEAPPKNVSLASDAPVPPSPCTDINPPPIAIPTTPLEEILDCRIGFLIEEQLYSLLEKFQDLVTVEGESSFSQKFLEEGLPLLDVYRPGFDQDKARSRFFGVSSPKNIIQEKIDSQYAEYERIYDIWHTANGNLAAAAGLAQIAFATIYPVGAFFTGLVVQLSSGKVNIPVGKRISQSEIDEGEAFEDSAEVFYTSVSTNVTYIYTNTKPGPALKKWTTDAAAFFSGFSDNVPENIYFKWNSGDDVPRLGTHGSANGPQDPRYDSDGNRRNPKDIRAAKFDDTLPVPDIPNPLARVDVETDFETFFRNILPGTHADAWLVPFPKLRDVIDLTGIKDSAIGTEKQTIRLSDGTDGAPARGQVILERYVKTKQNNLFGRPPDNFSGERFKEVSLGGPVNLIIPGGTPSATQVLSPKEVVNTSKRDCVDRDDSSHLPELIGLAPSATIGGEINIATEQVWSLDEFQEYLESPAVLPENLGGEVFDEVSFGLRMVYVAPPPPPVEAEQELVEIPQEQEAPSIFGPSRTQYDPIPNYKSVLTYGGNNAIEAGHRKIPIAIEDDELSPSLIPSTQEFTYDPTVVLSERTYFEYEAFRITEVSADIYLSPGGESGRGVSEKPVVLTDDEIGSYFGEDQWVERYLHLFPLLSTTWRIAGSAGIPKADLLDAILKSFSPNNPSKNIQEVYRDHYLEDLIRKMKNSSIYSYLFKYCIPGDTMLTFVSIYANMINELPEEFFDGTKFQLKSLFEVVSNGGDYTFETTEEKKRGGNRGEFARAMANYGTEGNARNPGLFDLAVKTPKQIFKGLAEFMDPVIKPASTIVKAGHAGKLLPQTMKILNPDGSPGGVNDKNFFVTDVIVPPGAVPPPVGDFNGEFPTVIRKSEQSLPLPGLAADAPEPLDNNEMVTFRLRDRITKGSDTGNSLFDRYLQKVFFRLYNPASQELYNAYSANEEPNINDRQKWHQDFIVSLVNRNVRKMAITLFDAYEADLEEVRLGIFKELLNEHNIDLGDPLDPQNNVLPNFSPATFKRLRENTDLDKCNARGIILSILKGERVVNADNFTAEGRYNLATGDLLVVNPETQKVETISVANGGGKVIDWIIWGNVRGSIRIPNPPKPEPVFPGYPLPLPVTPIAMSALPSDVVPYSPSPPHSPIGWAYHAIVAADNLQNIDLELKAVQREEEGLQNKKKLHEKLCIDMERISAEEKKRRGLE